MVLIPGLAAADAGCATFFCWEDHVLGAGEQPAEIHMLVQAGQKSFCLFCKAFPCAAERSPGLFSATRRRSKLFIKPLVYLFLCSFRSKGKHFATHIR